MKEFEAIKISDRVYWVGAIDWELRNFHGYNTSHGSTYNAYLVMGSEPVLIDTVKAPCFEEMLSRIKSVVDPDKIKYIISNHSEMDHSGSLPMTIKTVNPDKVFASKMGKQTLEEHFHLNYPITAVDNGENLMLGDANFSFIETRMLHWPDSMFSFFHDDGVLFSQDGFGMHLASADIFAVDNDKKIMHQEAAKYYANILMPYSKLVTNLIDKIPSFGLNIKIIAPDHGPIWRGTKEIDWIIGCWRKWAKQEPMKKVVIVYDTMWNSTASMVHAIAGGVRSSGVKAEILPISCCDRSDIASAILDAGALLVGSPTINQQMFPTVADTLCYLKGLKRQNLIGQVFGSYGWGGEAIKLLQGELEQMSVKLVEEPIKIKYVPTEEDLVTCREFGENIARYLMR